MLIKYYEFKIIKTMISILLQTYLTLTIRFFCSFKIKTIIFYNSFKLLKRMMENCFIIHLHIFIFNYFPLVGGYVKINFFWVPPKKVLNYV